MHATYVDNSTSILYVCIILQKNICKETFYYIFKSSGIFYYDQIWEGCKKIQSLDIIPKWDRFPLDIHSLLRFRDFSFPGKLAETEIRVNGKKMDMFFVI